MKNKPSVSVVIPLFNEEDNTLLLYQEVKSVCESLAQSYEIIFVDDGSTDRTFETLGKIHKLDAQARVIRFRKNYGQTAAMTAGFEYAQGEVIISMDGDLQNDPIDIPRLLVKMQEGYDVVCGWRKNRQDRLWTRRVPSVVANWIIGKVTGVHIHDNGCSLKAYRAPVIKNVMLYGEMHRFIPAMSTLVGARITEIVVNHHPRRFGSSKYGIGRVWRVALDIIMVKTITGFVSRPGLCFGLFSLPITMLGLLASSIAIGGFLSGLRMESHAPATVAFLCLFLASHLLSLGVVAELAMKTGSYFPKEEIRATLTNLEALQEQNKSNRRGSEVNLQK